MKILSFILFLSLLSISSNCFAQYTLFGEYDVLPSNGGQAMTEVEIQEHENLARCLCDEMNDTGDSYSYYLGLNYDGPYDSTDHYYYMGSDCSNVAVGIDQCYEVGTINVNLYNNQTQYIPIPVNYLVDPVDGVCSEINSGSNTFYIFSDMEQRTEVYTKTISYDTKPPTAPYDIKVTGGEGALTVSWNSDNIDEQGIEYFNILCMKDGTPSEVADSSKAEWVDTSDVCSKVLTLDGTGILDETGGDECPADAFAAGERPHKCFVCGSTSRTSDNIRISGLENGAVYSVAVVAVDDHRNVSEMSEVVDGTPIPTTDFAEEYRNQGGGAQGDYCFIATSVFHGKNHFAVQILRQFRDDVLRKYSLGKSFIAWYYSQGPTWAGYLDNHSFASFFIKVLLIPLVIIAAIAIVTPWWGFLLFLGFVYFLIHRKRLLHKFNRRHSLKYVS